jgi:hypothetical protein
VPVPFPVPIAAAVIVGSILTHTSFGVSVHALG